VPLSLEAGGRQHAAKKVTDSHLWAKVQQEKILLLRMMTQLT
jgi:hypothetical protein